MRVKEQAVLDYRQNLLSELREELGADSLSTPGALKEAFLEAALTVTEEQMIISDFELCRFERKAPKRQSIASLDAYAIEEDESEDVRFRQPTELHLIIADFRGGDEVHELDARSVRALITQCTRFYYHAENGNWASTADLPTNVAELVSWIRLVKPSVVRVTVLTDGRVAPRRYEKGEVGTATLVIDVIDIERLYRLSQDTDRDEAIHLDLMSEDGRGVPCFYINPEGAPYGYALTALPGDVLAKAYGEYGEHLLDSNVRSYLQMTRKTNKGIVSTLKNDPGSFTAFNNGLVIVAANIELGDEAENKSLTGVVGPRIVNGGQTTATLYFTARNDPNLDLSKVWVPTKIIVPAEEGTQLHSEFVKDIAKYANTQTAVKASDLSSSHPFHQRMEEISQKIYVGSTGKWFYERTAGSFRTYILRENNRAERKRLRTEVHPKSRVATKTDIVKAMVCWDQKPWQASLGNEKNLAGFIKELDGKYGKSLEAELEVLITPDYFREQAAKLIIHRRIHQMVRAMKAAFPMAVTNYTVAYLSYKYGDSIDLMRVWRDQELRGTYAERAFDLIPAISEAMAEISMGRNFTEVAKKTEMWNELLRRTLP